MLGAGPRLTGKENNLKKNNTSMGNKWEKVDTFESSPENPIPQLFNWLFIRFNALLDCLDNLNSSSRVGICHSRHSWRECKIFASGVNFSRNNAVSYINESKKLHFILISSLKLLTYYLLQGVSKKKVLSWFFVLFQFWRSDFTFLHVFRNQNSSLSYEWYSFISSAAILLNKSPQH